MKTKFIVCVFAAALAYVGVCAGGKYSVKVPGGLAFSEFKGYEGWQAISTSHNAKVVAVILGNPAMIDAYKSGFPENGKPAPDGAKMRCPGHSRTQGRRTRLLTEGLVEKGAAGHDSRRPCRVAGGNANKEIAAQLFLAEETVKSHIWNILAKLQANGRTHAVAIGLKRGIIDLYSRDIPAGCHIPRRREANEAFRGYRIPARIQYD